MTWKKSSDGKSISINQNFPFRYATDKKQRLKAEIEKALEHKREKQPG